MSLVHSCFRRFDVVVAMALALTVPAAALGPAAHADEQQIIFDPPVVQEIESNDVSFVLGQFGGSADLDVVYDDHWGGTHIRLGDGAGNFEWVAAGPEFTRHRPSLTAADLNGDGRVDIIATNAGADRMTVHLAKPHSIGFQPAVGYRYPEAGSVALADLDGDGDLDLALSTRDAVVVLENDGAGDLSKVASVNAPNTYRVLLADIDNNGAPELVIDEVGDRDKVAKGLGGFDFGRGKLIKPLSVERLRPQLADLNNDGNLDLAAIDAGSLLRMVVQFGNGDRTFGPPQYVESESGRYMYFVEALDLDLDGAVDLISPSGQGRIHIFSGQGDGTFDALAPIVQDVRSYRIGDLDGDGAPDLVVAHPYEDQLLSYLNRSTPDPG